ncbi:hypothetical protein FH5_02553 [Priestia endophytica]|nr:hypothetical protein FH5_02553 [Priestia endophytica]
MRDKGKHSLVFFFFCDQFPAEVAQIKKESKIFKTKILLSLLY